MVSTIPILLLLSLLLPIHAQYTTDCCRTDAECEGERACMFFEAPFTLLPCAPDLKDCRCSPADGGLLTCSFDFECPEGDVCTEGFDGFGCVSSNPIVAACPDAAEPAPENNPTVTPTPAPPTPAPPSPSPQPSDSSALSPDPSSNATPSPKPPGTGLTRDICETSSDCKPPRTCIPLTEESDSEDTECQPGQLCRCFPVDRCVVDGDCAKGEQCYDPAENGEATAGDGTFCVSRCSLLRKNDPDKFEEECKSSSAATDTPDPTDVEVVETPIPGVNVGTSVVPTSTPSVDVSTVDPDSTPDGETTTPITDVDTTTTPDEDAVDLADATPTPTSDAVCVAAEELEGVDKVFDRDFHAWVLCDSAGSCATPGHMVIWNGQGMMMRSYCDTVGCEKRVMAVNSPRWRTKGVRAKTDGLMYTSLAARFATVAEERVLAAVVRIAM